jgi:hypothetical protein
MNAAPHRLLLVLLALAAAAPAVRAQAKPAAKPEGGPPVSVQDTSTAAAIEMIRSDVRAEKTAILTQALELTDAQAKVFWPLYREYEAQSTKLGDERVALIRDFAVHYDSMTDAKALDLATRAQALDERRLKLRGEQIPIMSKALPGKIVARFLQVDALVNRAIDTKLSLELPFVK